MELSILLLVATFFMALISSILSGLAGGGSCMVMGSLFAMLPAGFEQELIKLLTYCIISDTVVIN